jgi:predicted DNA-binding transcriptional regulator AlpA
VLITRRSAEAWERRFEKQPANDDGASNAQWRLNHIQSLIADLSVEPGQLQNSRKPRKRAAPPDESPPPAPLAKPAGVLLLLDGLPSEQLLTVDQVLALIPVSVWTWRRGVRTGIFPAGVRVSRKSVFWRVGDIRAWLEGLKS